MLRREASSNNGWLWVAVQGERAGRLQHPVQLDQPHRHHRQIGHDIVFAVKRPLKRTDRAHPLVKNQEYAYAYDWQHRPG